ncbi:hypothetical protein BMF94_3891 [Rhodotorula taiwanensis]|uniref:DASH complex subunit DUO1 n=1 Tax=Rhodotorula taiwanensis TaxID=741276 RepID=A0A2S5B8F2_9BASI|nr:hypothetical protein BMF94_3891 [Rhodotorula taiwanensis]
MDDSTATFSPLPRSSLGGGGLGVTGGGFRGPGLVGRPSVGGLLQDEDMSLALAGDDPLDDVDDDDDEADADPFQRVPSAAGRRRHEPPSNAAEDQDDEPTLRLDSASTGTATSAPTRQAKSSADLFFGGSMAASASKPGVPPLGAAAAAGPSSSRRPASPSAHNAAHVPLPEASRPPGGSTGPHATGYEPDEDDVTDSALEARGYAPEELTRIRSLRDERDGLRTMNGVLEDVLGALRQTEGKMEASLFPDLASHAGPLELTCYACCFVTSQNFQATIETSHQLLDLYTRIASQAEHTKNLLLDGEWQGVERDYQILAEREQAAREAEEAAQREAEERAAREEAERVRKAQEEHARQRFLGHPPRLVSSTRASSRFLTPASNDLTFDSFRFADQFGDPYTGQR